MSINLSIPEQPVERELKPRITIIGVGGAGGNAVNDMINSQLEGVEFLVVNTDAQSLKCSGAERRVQMGASITNGLGAGASPEIGRAAAEESMGEIMEHLDGANMVFIAAGMGGGTGTGGAPVIAKAAREKGILTVGVVTKPFHFEGHHRMKLAEQGIEELSSYVDTLIVIPNQNLFRVANEKTTFAEAFRMADEVLYSGVRGVTDLIIMPGMINLDFADIRSVMHEMGKAMMGTGEADGERRALDAAEAAIANPLLDDCSMKGAKGVLINITGGSDMTLFEVDEAANRIRSEVDEDAYIIFGSAYEADLEGKIRVSVVATGIDADMAARAVPAMPGFSTMASISSSAVPTDDTPEVLRVEDSALETAEVALEDAFKVSEEEPVTEQAPMSFSILKEAVSSPSADVTEDEDEIKAEVAETSLDTAAESDIAIHHEVTDMPVSEQPVAEAPVASAAPDVPAAMPNASSSDAFIPHPPALASGKEEVAPTKPLAVTDMLNGSKEPAAVISEPTVRRPVIARAGKLFDRILGSNKATTTPQPSDWKGGNTDDAAVAAASATSSRFGRASAPAPTLASAQPHMPSAGSAQPSLGVVEQPETIAVAEAEDDLLDIPAFLRRQAN